MGHVLIFRQIKGKLVTNLPIPTPQLTQCATEDIIDRLCMRLYNALTNSAQYI